VFLFSSSVQEDELQGLDDTRPEGHDSWALDERGAPDANVSTGGAAPAQAADAADPAARAAAARALSAFVARHAPALFTGSRSVSESGAAGRAALAPPVAAPRHTPASHALCAAALASLCGALRAEAWMQSHVLQGEIEDLVRAVAPADVAPALAFALQDTAHRASQRVHAVAHAVQAAAARLFDARAALAHWRAAHDAAAAGLLRHFAACGASLRATAEAEVRAAREWVAGASGHTAALLQDLSAGILSFEASRAGAVWAPGTLCICESDVSSVCLSSC
jgi:hypothetical protein